MDSRLSLDRRDWSRHARRRHSYHRGGGGAYGAGYAYNDLDLPTDNGKEICGRITSQPSAGTLYANEDTSFTFSGASDGVYTFNYQLYVDGVSTGSPTTVTLYVGAISCSVAWLEQNDTFSATGEIPTTGAASWAEANDTISITGAAKVTASGSWTEASDALSSTGELTCSGVVSVTETNDVLSATGQVVLDVDGAVSITEANDTVSLAVSLEVSGVLSLQESNDSITTSGYVSAPPSGTVSWAETNDVLAAYGTVGIYTQSILRTYTTASKNRVYIVMRP